MKKLLLTILICLWAGSAWGAEFWVDNSIEDEKYIGIGTEETPFNTVADLEAVVEPLSKHTINLIGTNKPYQGGLGGKALRSWIFKECIVAKHEKDGKVTFTASRSIPVAVLTGDAKKDAELFKHLNMRGKRLYKDGDNLVLTRPFNLRHVDREKGYALDSVASEISIDTSRIATKEDYEARKAEIAEIKKPSITADVGVQK